VRGWVSGIRTAIEDGKKAYTLAKETHVHTKETYLSQNRHHSKHKRDVLTHTHTREMYLHTKETHVHTKEAYLTQNRHL